MTLCFINFFANSAYSSIAPFFPTEAVEKGLPESYLGLIFSGYSLSMVVFAPVLAKLITKHGQKKILALGCLSESIAMLTFGVLIYLDDPVAYGVLCFICRIVEGFGNCCLNSATSSLICTQYSDNMGNLMGITQTFTGLGMLAGPVVGSFLYELGGFKLPFFVMGSMLFLLVIPICFFVKAGKPL